MVYNDPTDMHIGKLKECYYRSKEGSLIGRICKARGQRGYAHGCVMGRENDKDRMYWRTGCTQVSGWMPEAR